MTGLPLSSFALASGLALILIGLLAMLTHKNIIRMIIGFSLVDTGIHMVMVAIGYVTGGSAPIIDDTLPSALVLTAIVIGLGVTAVMLSFAVRIYRAKRSLSIDDCAESKW